MNLAVDEKLSEYAAQKTIDCEVNLHKKPMARPMRRVAGVWKGAAFEQKGAQTARSSLRFQFLPAKTAASK